MYMYVTHGSIVTAGVCVCVCSLTMQEAYETIATDGDWSTKFHWQGGIDDEKTAFGKYVLNYPVLASLTYMLYYVVGDITMYRYDFMG